MSFHPSTTAERYLPVILQEEDDGVLLGIIRGLEDDTLVKLVRELAGKRRRRKRSDKHRNEDTDRMVFEVLKRAGAPMSTQGVEEQVTSRNHEQIARSLRRMASRGLLARWRQSRKAIWELIDVHSSFTPRIYMPQSYKDRTERLLELLESHPRNGAELSRITGYSCGQVGRTLRDLRMEGKVERLGGAGGPKVRWALPGADPDKVHRRLSAMWGR